MRKPYNREEKNTLGYTTLVYPAADNLLLITIYHLIFFLFVLIIILKMKSV
jgi:hypothetical protein